MRSLHQPPARTHLTLDSGHSPPNHGQFSASRFALLFKPGSYDVECPVGFYTQVLGLGKAPTDVTFTSPRGVFSQEGDFSIGGALSSFWRGAENFRTQADFKWYVGSGMMWAVSQAAPVRRLVVDNDLLLFEYEPPISPAGEASGGFAANVQVGGFVKPGSQQQWYARDSEVSPGKWTGGVWNMVFSGVQGSPPPQCGDVGPGGKQVTPVTTLPATPVGRSRAPALRAACDPPGRLRRRWRRSRLSPSTAPASTRSRFRRPRPTRPAPTLRARSVRRAAGWRRLAHAGGRQARAVPFEQVHVAQPGAAAADINAKLAAGLHVVLSPGVYHLEAPLRLVKAGQVLLGLGFATCVLPLPPIAPRADRAPAGWCRRSRLLW